MMATIKDDNVLVDAALPERGSNNEKEAVMAEVQRRFHRSPYRELRGVDCDFHEGVLTMRGKVPNYFLVQIAQSLVFSMQRIELIDNRLEVAET